MKKYSCIEGTMIINVYLNSTGTQSPPPPGHRRLCNIGSSSLSCRQMFDFDGQKYFTLTSNKTIYEQKGKDQIISNPKTDKVAHTVYLAQYIAAIWPVIK